MTHVSFNSYASKILENHPLAVWGLDDNLHYLSAFIDEENLGYSRRDFYTWKPENCIISSVLGDYPNGLSHEFKVTGRMIPNTSATSCRLSLGGITRWIELLNNEENNKWSYVDQNYDNWQEVLDKPLSLQVLQDAGRNSLCVSFFTSFDPSLNLSSFNLKINYLNKTTNIAENQIVNCSIPTNFENWKKILGTFNMSNVGEGFVLSIEAVLDTPAPFDKNIWLAGLNIGYWSEVFCHEFNAVDSHPLPENISNVIGSGRYASIKSFFGDDNGWAIVDGGRLLAMHDGLPIVYGSVNQTCLYAHRTVGKPSLVLPSKGFLTKSGKYNDSTFEFWMRLDNKSQTPFKIFGTFNSTDGLYAERGYLTLKIGSKYASYYVGKWYRPMLVAIRYSSTNVSMLVNGEQVISITIDSVENDSLSSNEYLGFFCNNDTFPFEIDCIAIYPYYQPIELAKKNFVYGQSVEKSNMTDQLHNGETVYFDFAFSKYDVDFKYPDTTRWDTGTFTNVFVNEKVISVPSYELPSINIKNKNTNDAISETSWISNLYSTLPSDATYIHFKNLPEDQYGYLYYSTMNQLNEIIKMIYVDVSIDGAGPIFVLEDKTSKSYLKVSVGGLGPGEIDPKIILSFSNAGGQEKVLYSNYVNLYDRKKVGLNLEKFISFYSRFLNGFLTSPQSISIYVGGYAGESFKGNIYFVEFNGTEYSNTIASQDNGFYMNNTNSFMANNQLCFFKESGTIKMDLNISGYWRSSIPLAFFAKYIKDTGGNKYYDLDLLQLNVDAVVPSTENYENADIKTYITFQKNNIGLKSIFDFTQTQYVDNVIHIDNQDWENKKFYFRDNSVIYHPKSELVQKLLVGLHIKFDVKKSRSKSTMLKRLELTSVCFDVDKPYNIGTKFGKNIYPIARSDKATIYKTINPFTVTKDSLSYLHLTKTSGMQIIDDNLNYETGIYIPINEDKAPDYKLGAIRLWLRYSDANFPQSKKLFEINGKNQKYYATLVRDFDSDRAKIIFIDSQTNKQVENIKYIQEDTEVFNCVLTSQRWTSISIMFGNSINLSKVEGSLILFPGVLYQNIGIYENSNIAIFNILNSNIWSDISSLNWDDINDQEWKDIFNRTVNQTFFVDTVPVYKSLIGTQSEKFDDQKVIKTAVQSSVKIYKNVSVKNFVLRKAEPYYIE